MSNTSIAAPAICLLCNTLIKAGSSTIGPRDALINREVGFILFSSAAPTRPRVLCLSKIPIYVRRWDLWLLMVLSPDAHFSCDTPCHSAFDLAFARRSFVGELGSPAPNWRSSARCKKAPEVNSLGPSILDLAVACLEWLALGVDYRPT